jgi:two-component system, NarL family, response regulator
LSDHELETLNLIVSGKNNPEIALNLHITEGNVKFNISNISVKLEVRNRTQAVLAAIKRGIVQF